MSLNKPSPTSAELAAVKSRREVALLRRWLGGELLPTVEMSELAHVLPASVLANPPAPDAKRSADEYARDIRTSRRTIFRWQQIGRDAKDWCPLDAPERMLDWWNRRMGKRAPAELVDWVERSVKQRRAAAAGAASVTAPAPAAKPATPAVAGSTEPGASDASASPPLDPVNLSTKSGHGLEIAVATMKRSVEVLGDALADAWMKGDEYARDSAQKKFNSAVEELRKAEQSLLAMQKARGDLAPRAEFTADLVTLATALRGMHARMPENVLSDIRKSPVAFTEEQLAAIRRAVAAVRDAEQHLFRNARQWTLSPDGAVLPAAAPAAA